MAKQTGKSLLSGTQVNKAHAGLKGTSTQYDSGGSPPAGIENGIARLVDIKIDKYKSGDNKGKLFFYAAGVIVAPDKHEGIPVRNLRTSIMEPLCATPQRSRKTFEEHYAWVRNEISKLIGEGEIDKLKNPAEDIESIVFPALLKRKPFFRFRTWRGTATEAFPNPRVNEVWNGVVEYDEGAEESEEAVVDKVIDDSPEDDSPEEESVEGGSIGERAEAGDESAQATLLDQAEKSGLDPDEYSWEELADKLASGESQSGEESSPEWKPEVDDIYLFNYGGHVKSDADDHTDGLDALGRHAGLDPDEIPSWEEVADQLAENQYEFGVTKVDEKKETVSLKSMDAESVELSGVPWSALIKG